MSNLEANELVNFLSSVAFFSEVSNTSLKALCKSVEVENYIKNETIIKKDDEGDAMFVILKGEVKVHDNDHVYGVLHNGDCFGEYALIDDKKRSASITTTQRSEIAKISRKYFWDLMSKDNGFAQGILAVMIKRHRELDIIQEQLARSKHETDLINLKMSGLINGAMDAIIMFNSNYKIVLTNPSANVLLENDDVIQRNVLFFLDEESAHLIKNIIEDENNSSKLNNYLPQVIKVIGSNDKQTLNEGTISKYGSGDDIFYTLILRNIEERLIAEDKINLLTNQTQYLEDELKELTNSYGIVAEDLSMKNVLNLIEQVAKTDATVLINGETGTGKELVARGIHKSSNRNNKPLIRINCGAIPTNLIESELFGHKKGAFTGATSDRKGRFLLADKGTIFLDEIGELPIELQPKLLRVIQEGEFDPVGSSDTIKVDVRIIAATHRDLLKHAQDNKFREDLYYRLNVFPINVPPLRVRGTDITLIAEEMLQQYALKLNKPIIKLSENDKAILSSYNWPGNVRELQNLIERAVIVSQNGSINWETILPQSENTIKISNENTPQKILTSQELVAFERDNILRALRQTRWKISGDGGAAELLNLRPTTLASKIKALGIERPI